MSNFLDSMKKSLGISKPKPSTGHVLGGGPSPQSSSNSTSSPKSSSNGTNKEATSSVVEEYWEFDLEFTAEKLGMSIKEHKGAVLDQNNPDRVIEVSQAMVAGVNAGSEAQACGILEGDLIVALNGHALTHFDDFYNFLVAIGRPVKIRFLRKKTSAKPPNIAYKSSNGGLGSVKNSLSSMWRTIAQSSGNNSSNSSSNNNNSSSNNNNSSSNSNSNSNSNGNSGSKPILSEEEKEKRREAMTKAAAERAQRNNRYVTGTGGSSKKYSSSSIGSEKRGEREEKGEKEEGEEGGLSEETRRAAERVKESEQKLEKRLGYSPFKPHMSFTGNAPAPSIPPSSAPSSVPTASVSPLAPLPLEEDEQLVGEVEDSLAMLLSLGEETAQTALQTACKVFSNLSLRPHEPKFSSLRLSNPLFLSKLGGLAGGLELLQAGGFEFSRGEKAEEGAGRGDRGEVQREEAEYLVHPLSPLARRRLEYSLRRVQEILLELNNNNNST